jgi:GTPase
MAVTPQPKTPAAKTAAAKTTPAKTAPAKKTAVKKPAAKTAPAKAAAAPEPVVDSAQPATATAPVPEAATVAKPRTSKVAPRKAPVAPVDNAVLDDFFKKALVSGAPDQGDASAQPTDNQGPQRAGLIAIVGKPNVGKSTLLNALVGQKISITSRKAQTTRHRILGIRTHGVTQCVFADTPGFQTVHGNALNKALNKTVSGTVSGVDLVLFVVEAGSFTPADARVLKLLAKNTQVILIANKFDTIHRRAEIAPWLQTMQTQHNYAEIIPMSAKNTRDIERLLAVCEKYLPEQPWMYAADELTDRSEKFLAAEMVREKLFRLTGDELPYTSTVVIDQFSEEPGKTAKRLVKIAATIVVERDGHKAMVIGEGGERLKRIGMEARLELEKLMDAKVFLQLWVKVKSGWADNAVHLKSYGYE